METATPISIPVALTIAGSDCSGGAGIQADLKTFHSHSVYGVSAVTCVVSEVPGKVELIEAMSQKILGSQISVLLGGFPVKAAKTGMLYSAEHIRSVAAALSIVDDLALVIDPVMVATSGAPLMLPDAIGAYESLLFPRATVLTPNMDEAATLLRMAKGEKITDLRAAAIELSQNYGVAVLVKGGHRTDGEATDWLAYAGGEERFAGPFIEGVHTHGTGCTYSAAITAGLAKGLSLVDAVASGKAYVTEAIRRHFVWGDDLHALNHGAR
jgi:hydroxymethylpyrimidine/phosphomethylpyrimidine kinase